MRKKTKLTAWRLSARAIHLLEEAEKKSGMNKTEVIEVSLALYALQTPALARRARRVLAEAAMRLASQVGPKAAPRAGAAPRSTPPPPTRPLRSSTPEGPIRLVAA